MHRYAEQGCVYDREASERLGPMCRLTCARCTGVIVDAISVASVAQCMDDSRMASLQGKVVPRRDTHQLDGRLVR